MSRHDANKVIDDAAAIGLVPLPELAQRALLSSNPPDRLTAHLLLVHDSAATIANWLQDRWSAAEADWDAVGFGAATHDIGKALEPAELVGPGKRHEAEGQTFLIEFGIEPSLARFAATHGYALDDPRLQLEDLLVALADKIWKGARVADLEERIAHELATQMGVESWDVLVPLLDFIDEHAAGSDARLLWHASYPTAN